MLQKRRPLRGLPLRGGSTHGRRNVAHASPWRAAPRAVWQTLEVDTHPARSDDVRGADPSGRTAFGGHMVDSTLTNEVTPIMVGGRYFRH